MRRSLLLLHIVLGVALNTHAQFFVEMRGSGLLPIGGSSIATINRYYDKSSRLINYGRGLGGGVVIGRGVSDAVGFEARFGYIRGIQQNATETSQSKSTWQTNYFRFDAALRLTSSGEMVRGYVAVGPSFAIAPQLEYMKVLTLSGTNEEVGSYADVKETTNNYSGGAGYGGFGALGVMFKINGALHFFSELQVTAMDWAPKKLQYDQVYTPHQGPVSYGPSGIIRFVEIAEDPDEAARVHMPMSTWGFNFGVRYTFKKADRPPVPAP